MVLGILLRQDQLANDRSRTSNLVHSWRRCIREFVFGFCTTFSTKNDDDDDDDDGDDVVVEEHEEEEFKV
jgi:hypothetical protein